MDWRDSDTWATLALVVPFGTAILVLVPSIYVSLWFLTALPAAAVVGAACWAWALWGPLR